MVINSYSTHACWIWAYADSRLDAPHPINCFRTSTCRHSNLLFQDYSWFSHSLSTVLCWSHPLLFILFVCGLCPIWQVGMEVPALILTIGNFLDILGVTTKSCDISSNLLENKILEKFWVQGSICCHDNTVFDAMFRQILLFIAIFLQILTKHFKQKVILSLEIIYWIFFEHKPLQVFF